MSGFSCICGVICHLFIFFTKNYWLIIFGFILYGLGIGMGYYPILKTTWKYYPEKKGFLTGTILCVFGLCPMVFTSIADAVINPNGIPMENEIYPEKVANNMKYFALIMAITMGVCGILSQVLMFPLDNIISTDESIDNSIEKQEESFASNEIYLTKKDNKDKKDEKTDENNNLNEPFMQAFKSWRFHLFNFMSVGTLCKNILKIFNKKF